MIRYVESMAVHEGGEKHQDVVEAEQQIKGCLSVEIQLLRLKRQAESEVVWNEDGIVHTQTHRHNIQS